MKVEKLTEAVEAFEAPNERISAQIIFECQDCDYIWEDALFNYFEDELDLEDFIANCEADCPKCEGPAHVLDAVILQSNNFNNNDNPELVNKEPSRNKARTGRKLNRN